MPLICQLPRTALSTFELNFLPGNSQTKDPTNRCGWSLSASPREWLKLKGFWMVLSSILSFLEL